MQVRSSRQKFCDDDYAAGHDINWLNEIKEWENNIISGQTKMGKTFVNIILKKIYIIIFRLFYRLLLFFFAASCHWYYIA